MALSRPPARVEETKQSRVGPAPFRKDIQGLRAVAVVSVVLDHAFGWPTGGFVGVDVFFVVSGFLITNLLLKEFDATGVISFKAFYLRRLRRLMPAALLVLVATATFALLVFGAVKGQATAADAFFAAAFAANWHFALAGTDYFNAASSVSPLQHFWSLSVEEQFYFAWPWFMLGLLFLVKLRPGLGRPRILLSVSLGAAALISFVWAMRESADTPTFAYFSTFSRTWELCVGALLATGASLFCRIPALIRNVVALIGLGLLATSLMTINSDLPFPAPWGVVPVLGAAAVLASGIGATVPVLRLLEQRPMVWLGKISYSIYLWHFPVVVFAAALAPDSGRFGGVAQLAIIVLLASASYYFVEEPLRGSLLRPQLRLRGANLRRASVVFMGLLALAFAAGGIAHIKAADRDQAFASSQATLTRAALHLQASQPAAIRSNTAALVGALRAPSWPTLSPSVDSANLKPVDAWVDDGCLNVGQSTVSKCQYGTGPKLAALVGDSTAISYLPALESALGSGWRIQVMTLEQCPAASVRVITINAQGRGDPYPECDAHRKWALKWIAENRPGLAVVTDAVNTIERQVGKPESDGRVRGLADGLKNTLKQLASSSGAVVVLPPPPEGTPIRDCKTSVSEPSSCVRTPSTSYRQVLKADVEAVSGTAASNVSMIGTLDWFCVANACPAFVGHVPLMADADHLTQAGSARLADLLKLALRSRLAP